MTLNDDLPRCESCGHVLEDDCGCSCCSYRPEEIFAWFGSGEPDGVTKAPANLERLRLAEAEAERLAGIMGPEWAAGMYD